MTTNAQRNISEAPKNRPHKPLRDRQFAYTATLNVACYRKAANNSTLQISELRLIDAVRPSEGKPAHDNAAVLPQTGVAAGVAAAVSRARVSSVLRDDRAHIAVLGASALMVMSGVLILLNNGLSGSNTEPDMNQTLASEVPAVEQPVALRNSEVAIDAQSSSPLVEPLTANAAVVETDAANIARFDAYENQILDLETENEQLREQLFVAMRESDELNDETLYLNKELLGLELALEESNAAAEALIEVKTVYNFVNVPIGSSATDNASYLSDQYYDGTPLQVGAQGVLDDEAQHDAFFAEEADYDELVEQQTYDASGQFANTGGYADTTQYYGDNPDYDASGQ